MVVGIDTDVRGNREGAFYDLARIKISILKQCPCCRLGKRPAGTNGNQAILWFDDIAVSRDDQGDLVVGNSEQCFKALEHPVGPPVLDQLYRRPGEVATLFFKLSLKALEQGKGIGGSACKTRKDAAMVKPPDFTGIAFHDGIAESDLTIPADDHLRAPADTDYRRAVKVFHLLSSKEGA